MPGSLFETDLYSVYPLKAYELPRVFRKVVHRWGDTWYEVKDEHGVSTAYTSSPERAVLIARLLDAVEKYRR